MTRREKQRVVRLITVTVGSLVFLVFLYVCGLMVSSNYNKEIDSIKTSNDSIILIDGTGREWTLPKDSVEISVTINNNNTDNNTKDDTIQKLEIKKRD